MSTITTYSKKGRPLIMRLRQLQNGSPPVDARLSQFAYVKTPNEGGAETQYQSSRATVAGNPPFECVESTVREQVPEQTVGKKSGDADPSRRSPRRFEERPKTDQD